MNNSKYNQKLAKLFLPTFGKATREDENTMQVLHILGKGFNGSEIKKNSPLGRKLRAVKPR